MKPYYQDDLVTIYHGDALDVMRALPAGSVAACITDPPYSSGTRQANDRKASAIPKRGEKWSRAGIVWDSSYSSFGVSHLLNATLREARRVVTPGGHVYVFTDWRLYPTLALSVEWSGLFTNNLLVWAKPMYALGTNYRSQHELIVFASNGPASELTRHDVGNVLSARRTIGGDHPTEKPVDLIVQMLDASGGASVLDPFMGSGTTLVAAKTLGRRAIGIEIEERYCEIAAQRCSQEALALSFLPPSADHSADQQTMLDPEEAA
jgi:site-specific DNA-methyltransferase (adenine-specific)